MGEKYASPHKIYYRATEFIGFPKKKGVWEMELNPAPLMGIKGTIGRSEKRKKSVTTDIIHLCKLLRIRDNRMSTGLE